MHALTLIDILKARSKTLPDLTVYMSNTMGVL